MIDMFSGTQCVLGQIFGNYSNGLVAIDFIEDDDPILFGFFYADRNGRNVIRYNRLLKQEWSRVIRERRSANKVS